MNLRRIPRNVILNTMRERLAGGKSLEISKISKGDAYLARCIRRQRGGWSGVVSEIGEDPNKWRVGQQLTPDFVIEYLKERAAQGTLSYRSLIAERSAIPRAVRKHFGSWSLALQAAGLDHAQVAGFLIRRKWSPQAVRDAIAQRHKCGLAVTAKALHESDSGLYAAGVKYFGSWPNALDKNAPPIRQPRMKISDSHIIKAIQSRYAQGLPVHQTGMEPGSITQLGVCRFGKWSNALIAAGLDPEQINLHQKWPIDKIIAEIQRRKRMGIPINSCAVRRGQFQNSRLYDVCVYQYGSWDAALLAAGIKPDEVRLRNRWTAEKVLLALRELTKSGKRFNSSTLRSENQSLLSACGRYFGTWANIVKVAGIESPLNSKRTHWTRTSIINSLREYESSKRPFSDLPASFERSACRLFGSWNSALSAAFGFRYKNYISVAKPRGNRPSNA